jgi:hypothetical protein
MAMGCGLEPAAMACEKPRGLAVTGAFRCAGLGCYNRVRQFPGADMWGGEAGSIAPLSNCFWLGKNVTSILLRSR